MLARERDAYGGSSMLDQTLCYCCFCCCLDVKKAWECGVLGYVNARKLMQAVGVLTGIYSREELLATGVGESLLNQAD